MSLVAVQAQSSAMAELIQSPSRMGRTVSDRAGRARPRGTPEPLRGHSRGTPEPLRGPSSNRQRVGQAMPTASMAMRGSHGGLHSATKRDHEAPKLAPESTAKGARPTPTANGIPQVHPAKTQFNHKADGETSGRAMQGTKGLSGAPVVRKTWQIPPRAVAGRQNWDKTTRTGIRTYGASAEGIEPCWDSRVACHLLSTSSNADGADRTEPLMHAASDSGGPCQPGPLGRTISDTGSGARLKSCGLPNRARASGTTAPGEGSRSRTKAAGQAHLSAALRNQTVSGGLQKGTRGVQPRGRAQWGEPGGPRALRQPQGAEASANGVEGFRSTSGREQGLPGAPGQQKISRLRCKACRGREPERGDAQGAVLREKRRAVISSQKESEVAQFGVRGSAESLLNGAANDAAAQSPPHAIDEDEVAPRGSSPRAEPLSGTGTRGLATMPFPPPVQHDGAQTGMLMKRPVARHLHTRSELPPRLALWAGPTKPGLVHESPSVSSRMVRKLLREDMGVGAAPVVGPTANLGQAGAYRPWHLAEPRSSSSYGADARHQHGRWETATQGQIGAPVSDSNSVAGGTEPVPNEGSWLPNEDAGVLLPDDDVTPPPALAAPPFEKLSTAVAKELGALESYHQDAVVMHCWTDGGGSLYEDGEDMAATHQTHGAAMGAVCGVSEGKETAVSTVCGAGMRDHAQGRRQGTKGREGGDWSEPGRVSVEAFGSALVTASSSMRTGTTRAHGVRAGASFLPIVSSKAPRDPMPLWNSLGLLHGRPRDGPPSAARTQGARPGNGVRRSERETRDESASRAPATPATQSKDQAQGPCSSAYLDGEQTGDTAKQPDSRSTTDRHHMRPRASPGHVQLQAEAGTPLEGSAEETEAERVDGVQELQAAEKEHGGAVDPAGLEGCLKGEGGSTWPSSWEGGSEASSVECPRGGDLVGGDEEWQEESAEMAVQQGAERAAESFAELALHEGAESASESRAAEVAMEGSSESAWDGQSSGVLVADTQEPHWVEAGIEPSFPSHPLERPSGSVSKGLQCILLQPLPLLPHATHVLHWNDPVDATHLLERSRPEDPGAWALPHAPGSLGLRTQTPRGLPHTPRSPESRPKSPVGSECSGGLSTIQLREEEEGYEAGESLQSESVGINVAELEEGASDEGASASGNDTPRQSTSSAFFSLDLQDASEPGSRSARGGTRLRTAELNESGSNTPRAGNPDAGMSGLEEQRGLESGGGLPREDGGGSRSVVVPRGLSEPKRDELAARPDPVRPDWSHRDELRRERGHEGSQVEAGDVRARTCSLGGGELAGYEWDGGASRGPHRSSDEAGSTTSTAQAYSQLQRKASLDRDYPGSGRGRVPPPLGGPGESLSSWESFSQTAFRVGRDDVSDDADGNEGVSSDCNHRRTVAGQIGPGGQGLGERQAGQGERGWHGGERPGTAGGRTAADAGDSAPCIPATLPRSSWPDDISPMGSDAGTPRSWSFYRDRWQQGQESLKGQAGDSTQQGACKAPLVKDLGTGGSPGQAEAEELPTGAFGRLMAHRGYTTMIGAPGEQREAGVGGQRRQPAPGAASGSGATAEQPGPGGSEGGPRGGSTALQPTSGVREGALRGGNSAWEPGPGASEGAARGGKGALQPASGASEGQAGGSAGLLRPGALWGLFKHRRSVSCTGDLEQTHTFRGAPKESGRSVAVALPGIDPRPTGEDPPATGADPPPTGAGPLHTGTVHGAASGQRRKTKWLIKDKFPYPLAIREDEEAVGQGLAPLAALPSVCHSHSGRMASSHWPPLAQFSERHSGREGGPAALPLRRSWFGAVPHSLPSLRSGSEASSSPSSLPTSMKQPPDRSGAQVIPNSRHHRSKSSDPALLPSGAALPGQGSGFMLPSATQENTAETRDGRRQQPVSEADTGPVASERMSSGRRTSSMDELAWRQGSQDLPRRRRALVRQSSMPSSCAALQEEPDQLDTLSRVDQAPSAPSIRSRGKLSQLAFATVSPAQVSEGPASASSTAAQPSGLPDCAASSALLNTESPRLNTRSAPEASGIGFAHWAQKAVTLRATGLGRRSIAPSGPPSSALRARNSIFRSKTIDDVDEAEPRWAAEGTNVGAMAGGGAWPIEYFDSQEYWLVLRQQEKEEQRRDVPVPPPTPILSPVASSAHLNPLHRHRKQSSSNEPLPSACLHSNVPPGTSALGSVPAFEFTTPPVPSRWARPDQGPSTALDVPKAACYQSAMPAPAPGAEVPSGEETARAGQEGGVPNNPHAIGPSATLGLENGSGPVGRSAFLGRGSAAHPDGFMAGGPDSGAETEQGAGSGHAGTGDGSAEDAEFGETGLEGAGQGEPCLEDPRLNDAGQHWAPGTPAHALAMTDAKAGPDDSRLAGTGHWQPGTPAQALAKKDAEPGPDDSRLEDTVPWAPGTPAQALAKYFSEAGANDPRLAGMGHCQGGARAQGLTGADADMRGAMSKDKVQWGGGELAASGGGGLGEVGEAGADPENVLQLRLKALEAAVEALTQQSLAIAWGEDKDKWEVAHRQDTLQCAVLEERLGARLAELADAEEQAKRALSDADVARAELARQEEPCEVPLGQHPGIKASPEELTKWPDRLAEAEARLAEAEARLAEAHDRLAEAEATLAEARAEAAAMHREVARLQQWGEALQAQQRSLEAHVQDLLAQVGAAKQGKLALAERVLLQEGEMRHLRAKLYVLGSDA